ncbi:STE20-related kinase adapter protein alpha-like isoform X1 [Gigantopelta aegis]|uniref:STE20-related kinase adapter protein alpha-like isoform X1 n=1 Tax=Gigantopelta aegis TaxID=1735272 RepID=UPI001B88C392|nr:STE20-related kinase adapter protein alpha-like isoform X1 [Gigantopelta aegis]XP_041372079.1 STE20-related kinase adapter protein alpha-like isoform X1 [Gigantopelta aegis]
MSFLVSNCTCTKANVIDSPASRPFDRSIYTPLSTQDPENSKGSQDNSNMSSNPEQFEVDINHYELYTVIGKGHNNTATIFLAKHLPSKMLIAVKKIDLESEHLDFLLLQKEIFWANQLDHSRILNHYTSFIHNHELWVIMPLMAFGSACDLIHAYFITGLSETAAAYILRDTLLALEYLHSNGIIHRGIKASHVLIAANGKICLSGMQMAYSMIQDGRWLHTVHDYPSHAIPCLQWFSPEILEQNLSGYDTKSDIYSVGILACELCNGQAPFSDMPATQMLLEKLNGTKPMLADSTTLHEFTTDCETDEQNAIIFNRTFTPQFHDLVSLCLEKDPNQRPSATTLLTHPFFKNLKRKTNDILPNLLHPVKPLTDISKFLKDDKAVAALSDQVAEIQVSEDWDF